MADRPPFVYPDWCTGPVVDLDIGTGFPVCDYVTFTRPTYMHVPRIDTPDIDPPPFCPCIPTMIALDSATYDFGGDVSTFDIKIVPVTSDCCNPEFKIDFDIEVPCMPFEFAGTAMLTAGSTYRNKPKLTITKVPGTCKFEFNLKMPFAAGQDIQLCLYEHGEGIKFITCCQGTGYIGMDATMERQSEGTVQIKLYHNVNLKIPLLAALKNYSTAVCSGKLNPATQTVYDPWGQACVWKGTNNMPSSEVRKYCKHCED